MVQQGSIVPKILVVLGKIHFFKRDSLGILLLFPVILKTCLQLKIMTEYDPASDQKHSQRNEPNPYCITEEGGT